MLVVVVAEEEEEEEFLWTMMLLVGLMVSRWCHCVYCGVAEVEHVSRAWERGF